MTSTIQAMPDGSTHLPGACAHDRDWRLTQAATDATKARYAFVVGDFSRVHRSGLIAWVYRAAEWRHQQVELATHDLLQTWTASASEPRPGRPARTTLMLERLQ